MIDVSLQISRLSPLEPQARHKDLRANRINGIGDWVLQTKEFREWSLGRGGPLGDVLFCYGEPGVGKTYLCSLVLSHLGQQTRGRDVALAGLYYDFAAPKEYTPTNMLGAILKQVIDSKNIPEYLNHAFSLGILGLAHLTKMLKKTLASRRQAFICIDGLDECPAEYRALLLESLREVRDLRGVRIFFTGRRNIRDEIEKYLGDVNLIPVDPSSNDIMTLAKTKLGKDPKYGVMDNQLRSDFMKDIPGRKSETFLGVSLVMDLILAESTITGRRKKLKELAEVQSLEEAYTATIEHMKKENGIKRGVGMGALMWISHSERQLRTDELCQALDVKTGTNTVVTYGVPPLQRLLECSLGLFTVEGSSSTVRLVHFTLQRFLTQTPNTFMRPHSMMAQACLAFLAFRCVNINLSPATIAKMPAFADYASCYWGIHARKGKIEGVKLAAFRLLKSHGQHTSAKLLLMKSDYWSCYASSKKPFKGFSALHWVASFGIAELIVALKEEKFANVNGRDAFGSTPLVWAARSGSLEGVKALLEWAGVDPNLADNEGQTPLSIAAMNGHDEIVKLLLTRDDVIPSGGRGEHGLIPLGLAAWKGHESIVEVLLARQDVNPNLFEPFLCRTPLSRAAEAGNDGVVKLLLAREDVDPNGLVKDCSKTPLSLAAASGHEQVAKLLLARGGFIPGTAQEAFSQAVKHGHEGVVSLFLTREDVSPDEPNIYGRTPLSWAAEGGHDRVVRILANRNDICPDAADFSGRTPLSWAAQGGHERTVKRLLALDNVNPEAVDISGCSPLFWAANNAQERVVKLLLRRAGAWPSLAGAWSRLLIARASEDKHERRRNS